MGCDTIYWVRNRKNEVADAGATGEVAVVASSTKEALKKLHVPPIRIPKKADNAVAPSYRARIP